MTRRTRPLSVLAFLYGAILGAGAAQAGTVYVPLPGVTTVGTAAWEAELTFSNPATATASIKGVLLADDTDGTQRVGVIPGAADVLAGRTILHKPTATFRGLFELSGSPNVRYLARLSGTGSLGKMGVALPVVTSDNLAPANRKLTLQGLTKNATRATHLGIVNLASSTASCTLTLVRADGTAIGTAQTLAMKPLSHRYRTDVFAGLVDAAGVADARALVACTREFFAYAVLTDTATGEVAVIEPAGSGESTLALPGELPPCPTGAICLLPNEAVRTHTATPLKPVGRFTFNAPAGTFTRLRLFVDVTVAGWYGADPDAKHLVYWFVINKNIDMPGMLYFRGPDAYNALMRWGIGLKHPQKLKQTGPFTAIPGHTYHIVNDFDMGHGTFTVTITDAAGGEPVVLSGIPNVTQVTLKAGDKFLVDSGFPEGVVPDEAPGYNWFWSNYRVDVIP